MIKNLRLVTAKNLVLADPEKTLEEAEIEDGECLTALVLQPQVAATKFAFALWCPGDSAIFTWGGAKYGVSNSALQDQLKGVQQIQATNNAFAAILADGSVVLLGGGDSSAVRDQLKSNRFRPQVMHLLRFWKMGPSLPGALQTKAATARQSEISSRVCGGFKPHVRPLLPFLKMGPSLLGVMQLMVVIVRQSNMSLPKGKGSTLKWGAVGFDVPMDPVHLFAPKT